jgi:hypothetical protein
MRSGYPCPRGIIDLIEGCQCQCPRINALGAAPQCVVSAAFIFITPQGIQYIDIVKQSRHKRIARNGVMDATSINQSIRATAELGYGALDAECSPLLDSLRPGECSPLSLILFALVNALAACMVRCRSNRCVLSTLKITRTPRIIMLNVCCVCRKKRMNKDTGV